MRDNPMSPEAIDAGLLGIVPDALAYLTNAVAGREVAVKARVELARWLVQRGLDREEETPARVGDVTLDNVIALLGQAGHRS